MIKITATSGKGDDVTQLRVDGRIVVKTIGDLERACRAGLNGRWPLLLDFAGVTFMDADGATLVATLIDRGAVIVGATPFVNETLRACTRHDGTADDGPNADASFLARLRQGDDRAFDELTRRYAGRMLAVARRLLRNEEDARDAVQEAFVSAFKSLDRFHGHAKISTWLHRITVNAALMRLRRRKRKPEQSIEDLLPRFDETGEWIGTGTALAMPHEELERREMRATVRRCIDLLPASYRAILVLRDIEELDGDETAAALGLSVGAVKSRLHRARQALRTLLEREQGASESPAGSSRRNHDHDAASESHV